MSVRIIIFTGSSCPWCDRVRNYLREKRFRFKEINVERDRDGAKEMARRGIKGVPVVMIGSQVITGFDKPKIDRALGIRG